MNSKIIFIDTHCHLDKKYFPEGLSETIEKCKQNGVEYLIYPASTVKSNCQVIEVTKQYKSVYGLLGLHPHDAKDYSNEFESYLREKVVESKIVGVGEIGLDYHYNYSLPKIQRKVFESQLRLATEFDLPVQIHIREAFLDAINILKNTPLRTKPGIIHCFTGDKSQAKSFLELGFHISFSGIITFKSAEDIREACKYVPNTCLHIETDTPYLAPAPYRGKANKPYYVVHVAEKVAEIKELSVEEIAEITSKNTKELFSI